MKKALPYIAAALVLAAVLFLILNKPPENFDGRITLNHKEKIPYGTFVAFDLLKQHFPKAKIETNKLSPENWEILSFDSSDAGQILIIVNSYFNPDERDLDYLTGFAQKGNYVFVSALQMNDIARKFFKVEEKSMYGIDLFQQGGLKQFDSFAISLDTAVFMPPANFAYPGVSYDNYFLETDSNFTFPLGYNLKRQPNLLAINTQKGSIFLHSAPISFTNFFILYANNYQYYQKLMSLLPTDANKVVWDEYFLYKRNSDTGNDSKGVLSVMFQYQNFRWAFWLVITLLCLYLVTEIKRKQRIIPVFSKPANDSLEFVTTVGKLYFEKGDHKNLAEKLTLFFLDHVRNKYKISTSEINSFFAAKLSVKANVLLEEVNEIINSIHKVQLQHKISAKQLLHHYELLEKFYKKA